MTTLGQLTQRITIEQRTVTPDPLGGEVVTWVAVFRCNASVFYGTGAEAMRRDGLTAQTKASFRILNRKGLQARQRILYNNQAWDIEDIKPDSKRMFMDLVCTQGVNDG
jgi:SPP1 family predicted phage head-tail adaptor